MADLEQGLWGSALVDSPEAPISHTFVTALFKGDTGPAPGHMAIKGGDAQTGPLTVYYDGQRPPRYAPMKKQGQIILVRCWRGWGGRVRFSYHPPSNNREKGIGGDNSDGSTGTFYEGAMIRGFTADATDAALQANVVAAGYSLK